MTASSLSAESRKAISQTAILHWIDEVRAVFKDSPYADLLQVEGVDTIDALLSPIFLAVLNALRASPAPSQPRTVKILGRLHNWAYDRKVAWLDKKVARLSAQPERVDVLLWSRHHTHTVVFHPIARALSEQGTRCRMLACEAKTFQGLQQYDPRATFTLGAWPRKVREAQREGHRRAKQLTRTGSWNLPPFPQFENVDLESMLRETITQCLPFLSTAIANTRAAIETFQPKVLVVGNDLTMEGRVGCRIAAEQSVPTALFMHGSIGGSALQSRHVADHILVFGAIHRRQLIQQGIAAERIEICGAPHLGKNLQQSGQIHPWLQARLGLRTGEPWILVATSGPGHSVSHHHHQVLVRNLTQLGEALPGVPIIVKLHPKDHVEFYQQERIGSAAARLTVVSHGESGFPGDIFGWLQGCPLLLTGASTVAVEAMLMKVPVVTMDFCNEIHDVDFIDQGATVHVKSGEALKESVQKILAAGGQPAEVEAHVQVYVKEAFHALEDGAASRGAQLLREIMKDRD